MGRPNKFKSGSKTLSLTFEKSDVHTLIENFHYTIPQLNEMVRGMFIDLINSHADPKDIVKRKMEEYLNLRESANIKYTSFAKKLEQMENEEVEEEEHKTQQQTQLRESFKRIIYKIFDTKSKQLKNDGKGGYVWNYLPVHIEALKNLLEAPAFNHIMEKLEFYSKKPELIKYPTQYTPVIEILEIEIFDSGDTFES